MANPSEIDTSPTKDGAEPKRMSMLGFVDEFKRIHDTMPNRRFAFILGAGASKSSGVKLAGEMAKEWVAILHRQAIGASGQPLSKWATAENLGLRHYDHSDPAASYSELYRRMYGDDPDQGFAYLEAQMAGAEPGYGYSVLGRVLAELRHQVVITVNFDNLVADSLSLFSATYPLVCGHESLAHFARTDLRRPLVLKVHRDLLLSPMSDPDDLCSVDPTLQKAITGLLRQYTPIVIGYGGNDDSLMGCLEGIPQAEIPGGLYWCYRVADGQPPQRIRKLVAKHRGYLVPIRGFDELMSLLGDQLQMINPAELITERAKQRAERLNQQQESISKAWEEQASKPILAPANQEPGGVGNPSVENNPPAEGGVDRTQAEAEIDAVARSVLHSMGKSETAKPWWRWEREAASAGDEDRRDGIYRAAVAALPYSSELLGNYANFLTDVRKDHDAAEALYLRALEVDPKRAISLGNYANFLTDVRKDHDAAETFYQRALEADSMHANNLGNYAFFLTDVRKDHDAAETLYRRALEADPKHANNLGNYAGFLKNVRKEHETAQTLYQRALEADPNHARILSNYANFLKNVRKDHDGAERLYQRAIEADPKHAGILGNYANFLTDVRKDHDRAETLYRQALEADPQHANILGNYAIFLTSVRKDDDAAEATYKRALEADPRNATILGKYAAFLMDVRKDHDTAEAMYRRGLEADPKHAATLGSYADFLTDVRKDHDAAEAMYQRALEANPMDATNLGNYATFLKNVRKDHDAAETLYRRALEADPQDAGILGNYATFLEIVRKDHDAAETLYRRALEADPQDAGTLGNYSVFLADVREDHDGAETMHRRALEAAPKHANILGNYARFLLARGRTAVGLATLDAAFANMGAEAHPELAAECWMYAYCARAGSAQVEALKQIKQLVVTDSVRTGEWDFSGVIAHAERLGHPEASWLPVLARVLAGEEEPAALSAWTAWSSA